ncbi:MAG: class I SAM-dependent methyltransferase [Waterburya sp.]
MYTNANIINWNSRAKCHHESREVGDLLAKLKNGQGTLKEIETNLLGDIKGMKILHLMCHNGLDSISLALKGANVTAVDFSQESLDYAQKYSSMLNVTGIEFILGDIHFHLDCLDNKFDIVFMTYGVLCWLSDLSQVFTNAAKYLKNRGQLLLIDHHPFLDLLSCQDTELKLTGQYFYDPLPEKCICTTSYIGSSQLANPTTYQWSHNIGNIIEILITSGFILEHFKEYPWIDYQKYPFLVQKEGRYQLPENMTQIPMLFSLLASLK